MMLGRHHFLPVTTSPSLFSTVVRISDKDTQKEQDGMDVHKSPLSNFLCYATVGVVPSIQVLSEAARKKKKNLLVHKPHSHPHIHGSF